MRKRLLLFLILLLSLVPARLAVAQSEPTAAAFEPPRQLVIELEVPAAVCGWAYGLGKSDGEFKDELGGVRWIFTH